jgi:glycosyltransferase involved in cell wall biosynthesis
MMSGLRAEEVQRGAGLLAGARALKTAPQDHSGQSTKRVLLVSNRVMHYRVSLYNAFHSRFAANGWKLSVRANELQRENTHSLAFDFREVQFRFRNYRREILRLRPEVVILFLHLKDLMIWPLTHWLKLTGHPFIFWTKGANLDDPRNRVRHLFFVYVHALSDALLLYSKNELRYVRDRHRHKVFVANNTINFADFPSVVQTKEAIKAELGIPFRRVVLFTGRMGVGGERKKVEHLIETFRGIDEDGLGCVIVGSGMPEGLRRTMNSKNTLYLGEVHDPEHRAISKLFAMADVFCIPGHVGLGLNQAMYWGLPVVTEEGRQPPEIHYLANGRNGFLVPENDTDALKQRLLLLLNDDRRRAEMSGNARHDILANASTEGMFDGFLAAVEYCHGVGREPR